MISKWKVTYDPSSAMMRWFGYYEKTVGDVGNCSGNVMYGLERYLCNGFLMDMMNPRWWLGLHPTWNKSGFVETSYDG